jgi:transposase InsO family protein
MTICGLGLDLVRGYTHPLLAVDKFTKCIEARSIATISSEQAVEFFLDIIHRFGVPNSIIMNNGMQFKGKKFLNSCVDWAVVAHPRTNGQVERVNGMMLQGLKPRIFNQLKKFAR